MAIQYAALFQPFHIGKLEIKNRICMAPMLPGGWLDADKNVTDETIAYYEARAKGGAGLIFTGASFPNAGLEITDFTRSPFAKPNTFLVQTRKLADTVHKYGCKLFVQQQLGCGRTAVPAVMEGLPVAPSPVADRYDPSVICRELTTEEVYRLIDAVVEGAVLSWQAGADGVNINGVKGGYLGDQFATAAFNHRTDEFGGDLEGRARLMVEIVKRIKAACGQDFPVTTRLGTKAHMKAERVGHLPGEDYQEFGRDMEESLALGRILEEAGYDAILFGTGTYDSIYWLYPPMYMPDGCYIEEASALKQALHIPVICPGKLSDPDMANEAVRDGRIDALSIGRGLVADPEWPNKVKSGNIAEIRPCISCNNGCIARVLNGMTMQCAVNSDVFCEKAAAEKYRKSECPKRVAVIGGGIAGLEAARVAAIRGHRVTVYEKNGQLGGLMLPSEVPGFKKADRKLMDWYRLQLQKLGVECRLNTELDAGAVQKLDADVLVIATGSRPRKLPVPGGDLPHVAAAEDVLLGKQQPGKQVVLVGGGQVGCETAIWLKEQGCQVSVVEGLSELIAGKAEPVPQPNRDMLLELLIYHQIPTYTGASVQAITSDGVQIACGGKELVLPADSVVVSIGYQADDALYRQVYGATEKPVWLLGDAKKPGNIMSAIRDGSAIGALI